MAVVRNSLEKIEEVQEAAQKLHLSKDVSGWSREDVQKWILWAIREFYSLCLDLLEIDGQELATLKLSEFNQRVPDLATYFYNELRIWKQALDPDHHESIFISTTPDKKDVEKPEELPTYVSQLSQTPNSSPWRDEEILDVTPYNDDDSDGGAMDSRVLSLSYEQIPSPRSVEPINVSTPKPQQSPDIVIPDINVKSEKMSPEMQKLPSIPPSSPSVPFLHPLLGCHTPILSPHIMSHGQRPSLIIPSPGMLSFPPQFGGFQVPYPVSPALLPQSPFRSPLISPDVHSPSLLPNMEALKENIVRLEQHRQRRLLERHHSQEFPPNKPVKRRKKRRSTKESENLETVEGISKQDEVKKQTEVQPIMIPTPNLVVDPPRQIEKVRKSSEGEPKTPQNRYLTPTLEHPIHPAVVEFLMRQNSQNALEQLQNNNNTIGKVKRPPSAASSGKGELVNRTPGPSEGVSAMQNPPQLPDQPQEWKQSDQNGEKSVTVVRRNSHEIPYYQATSLEPNSLETSKDKYATVEDENDSEPITDFQQFNIPSTPQREVSCSSRTEASSARDSYSPISSPSDTEVDFKDRELHPHYKVIDYSEHMFPDGRSNPSTSALPYSPDQQPHLPMIPTVISSTSTNSSTAAGILPQNSGYQPLKTHKKRGRPPGSKMLSRPLGPSDIHAGMFRANHLWKFLLEMLEQPQQFGASIQWLERANGVFKIINSAHVASMWGKRKNNGKMTYDKFSRSIRQYYKKGIIIKTKPSKLIYQFGSEYFNPNLE